MMTALLAWCALWTLAVIGLDRVICWAAAWAERRLNWWRIKRDMVATVRRIQRKGARGG